MANVDRKNGFKPVEYLGGAPWTGKARRYVVPASDANNIFLGDLVKLSGTTQDGYQAVTVAAAGDALVGAVVGVDQVDHGQTSLAGGGANDVNLSLVYREASKLAFVWVADDPTLVFEAQEDGVGGGVAATDIGLNINFVAGAGSTSTGYSGHQIDSSTKATTATLPLKLVGLSQRPDNDFDTTNGLAKLKVTINNHQLNSGTGTVGV